MYVHIYYVDIKTFPPCHAGHSKTLIFRKPSFGSKMVFTYLRKEKSMHNVYLLENFPNEIVSLKIFFVQYYFSALIFIYIYIYIYRFLLILLEDTLCV